jgi:hypothetical protein
MEPNDFVREMNCSVCKTHVSDESPIAVIHFFKKCCHEVCQECVQSLSLDTYPFVECPTEGCTQHLMLSEIENVFGVEACEKIQEEQVLKAFEKKSDILVQCKCGNKAIFEEGPIYYDIKGKDNQVISQ